MRNYPGLSRWAPNPMRTTSVPAGEKQREIGDGQKRGGNVTVEAEPGMMSPSGKECCQPSEAGRGKRNSSPREPQKSTVPPTP